MKYELHCAGHRRRESVWTRLLGKQGDFSGAQDAWRDWSAVFWSYADAAVPRQQKLMVEAALYWMMLTTCKGATLNIVFLAGDSEGLAGWRQLTEKYEPKMRTRFAGQLLSILSPSPQGDATERITAWERDMATYERDSGKVLDDEIKIGTFLLRLPESKLKTHLPMRVDTLKNGQISGAYLLRSLEQSPRLRHSRPRWTLEP